MAATTLLKRQLSRAPLELTSLGFGGAAIAELFEVSSEKQAAKTVSAAWDLGVRYFDTAPWYGRGQGEIRMGRSLYRRMPRDSFVLSTKVGRTFRRPSLDQRRTFDTGFWKGGLHFDPVFDYSYDGIMYSYEQSLIRLGMNEVDILLVHDLDRQEHSEDAFKKHYDDLLSSGFKALEELRRTGEVKAIGTGINRAGEMSQYLDKIDVDVFLVSQCYTLLDHQQTMEYELPRCEELGINIIVGAPFNSGILVTGPTENAMYNYSPASDEVKERVKQIQNVCSKHDVPLPAAALQFPLMHPCCTTVIPGMNSFEHAHAAVKWANTPIPREFWDELITTGIVLPGTISKE